LYLPLAGVFVFLGFLTKGPVALYPLAVPFLFALVLEPEQRLRGFRYSVLTGLVSLALFAALLLLPEVRHYFQNYWEQRLSVALAGGREDGLLTGWKRLNTVKILFRELSPLYILGLLFWGLGRWKKLDFAAGQRERAIGLFFFVAGLGATLPLMASTRQAGMYLIAGFPMFAFAAGYFYLPLLQQFFPTEPEQKRRLAKRLNTIFGLGLFLTLLFVGTKIGQPGREKAELRDIEQLQKIIPAGSTIGVCDDMMRSFVLHTYLQRYQRLEFSAEKTANQFFATTHKCDAAEQTTLKLNGYTRTVFSGEVVTIYSK
jgi:4-amino-4-deoxy-L-arabinose transferase-like glycosyltransferase